MKQFYYSELQWTASARGFDLYIYWITREKISRSKFFALYRLHNLHPSKYFFLFDSFIWKFNEINVHWYKFHFQAKNSECLNIHHVREIYLLIMFVVAQIPQENWRHDRKDIGRHVPWDDHQIGQYSWSYTVQAVAIRRRLAHWFIVEFCSKLSIVLFFFSTLMLNNECCESALKSLSVVQVFLKSTRLLIPQFSWSINLTARYFKSSTCS